MDVLRNMVDAVKPGGIVLDLQVIRPNPIVEVDGRQSCEIDGEPLFRWADAATAAVDALVVAGHLVHLKSGYKLRVEVAYAARFVGGVLKLNPMEIIAADWFNLENLPDGLLPAHRSLIEANRDWYLHGSSTTPEAHDDPVTSRGAGR